MRIFAFADEACPQIDGQIKALTRNGLQGLEIRNVDGQNVSDISLEKAREVRSKLEDAGLVTRSVGSPIGKIDIVRDDNQAHMEKLKHTLEVAGELGAGNIRMFSYYIPQGEDPENYRNEVIDRLGAMLELAKGTGVDLCHENEKGFYGDVAPRCAELLRQLPDLKGIFDPANFIQSGQETLEAWEMLHDRIKYMHIKDALENHSVVPAGRGVGHLAELLKMFRAQGGNNVTIEPHLAVFAGLSDLEREGQTSKVGVYSYPNSDAAFDAAADALKEIL